MEAWCMETIFFAGGALITLLFFLSQSLLSLIHI